MTCIFPTAAVGDEKDRGRKAQPMLSGGEVQETGWHGTAEDGSHLGIPQSGRLHDLTLGMYTPIRGNKQIPLSGRDHEIAMKNVIRHRWSYES